MELAVILTIGILFGAGVYLLLEKNLLRVVFGTVLSSNAINLMLLVSGRLKRGGPPVLPPAEAGGEETTYVLGTGSEILGAVPITDPLPQALILTAIVIGFATTALVLVLAYRTYQENGTDNLEQLREMENE